MADNILAFQSIKATARKANAPYEVAKRHLIRTTHRHFNAQGEPRRIDGNKLGLRRRIELSDITI